MQDKVFSQLWRLDICGCLKFAHEMLNQTAQYRNTLSPIKDCTAKLSHVGDGKRECAGQVIVVLVL